jgi:hypothetical protein
MRGITVGSALMIAALAAGCAATPRAGADSAAPVTARAGAGHAGSWEVVLPGRNLTGAPAGPEVSRLDTALAVRDPETIMDQTLWPPAHGPRLDDLRRRFISDDPRIVNYYGAYGGGPAWWYGGWRWR